MKFALAYFLTTSFFFTLNAQIGSHAVKRYAKIQGEFRYTITEYIFEDGHIENFITRKNISSKSDDVSEEILKGFDHNIEWDENEEIAGFQMTMKDEEVIENAFNNAIGQVEKQMNLPNKSFARIDLDGDFLKLKESDQSKKLLFEIQKAFANDIDFSSPVQRIGSNKLNQKTDLFAVFASNEVTDLGHANIRAIYNWIFADAHTGWSKRMFLLKEENPENLEEKGGKIIYKEIASNKFELNNIINNPTLRIKNSFAYQIADSVNKRSELIEQYKSIKPSLTSEVAAKE